MHRDKVASEIHCKTQLVCRTSLIIQKNIVENRGGEPYINPFLDRYFIEITFV